MTKPCMSQSDEVCEQGLRRQRAEPVLGLRDFLLICDVWLGAVSRWHRLVSGQLLTLSYGRGALSQQPAFRAGVDAAMAGAVSR